MDTLLHFECFILFSLRFLCFSFVYCAFICFTTSYIYSPSPFVYFCYTFHSWAPSSISDISSRSYTPCFSFRTRAASFGHRMTHFIIPLPFGVPQTPPRTSSPSPISSRSIPLCSYDWGQSLFQLGGDDEHGYVLPYENAIYT